MEYVKGVPITQYCDATRLSIADRLNLFVQVCSAVQHAHQKGIIHLDLKPSNILVAPYDDKAVPKVIDFGLAKAMGRHSRRRRAGQPAGRRACGVHAALGRRGGAAQARRDAREGARQVITGTCERSAFYNKR
jgi:serine/threonine protein kinase